MRLTLQSDYGLRLLTYLAVANNRQVTVGEVADRFGISRHHLTKVAQHLVQAGLVESLRGRGGGLRLAKPAESVVLGVVVRELESDFALVECLPGGKDCCLISPACRLKGVLGEAMGAFLAVLDGYSLQDLVGCNPALEGLLLEEVA